MLVPILLFVLGLILLIKGGDWFVDGSVELAHRLHVPELIIGATVVSIGTTLPEVLVSATGAIEGHSGIAYGNAIGSVICNTALISALTFAVRPCSVDGKAYRIPVLFFFAAAALYAGTAYATGYFSRWTGLALLAMFAAYIAYTIVHGKKNGLIGAETEETEAEENETKETPLWKSILKLAAGAACIAVGARLLVDNGTVIAESLGVPQSVIALTFVALGTSLPELVTAITALVKGHSAVTIHPFSILAMENKTIGGTPVSLIVDIPVMLFVMAFMTLPALKREKLTRVQGIVLLCIYAAFCIFQFVY